MVDKLWWMMKHGKLRRVSKCIMNRKCHYDRTPFVRYAGRQPFTDLKLYLKKENFYFRFRIMGEKFEHLFKLLNELTLFKTWSSCTEPLFPMLFVFQFIFVNHVLWNSVSSIAQMTSHLFIFFSLRSLTHNSFRSIHQTDKPLSQRLNKQTSILRNGTDIETKWNFIIILFCTGKTIENRT